MKRLAYSLLLVLPLLSGCIGDDILDDFVPARLVITNAIDSLRVGETYQLEVNYFNNIGQAESRPVTWSSSNTSLVDISTGGLLTAKAVGQVSIIATAGDAADTIRVTSNQDVTSPPPSNATTRRGTLRTTSSYALAGDFTLETSGERLVLRLASNYATSDRLPGLYLYLTNNPNSVSGAFEVGMVTVFQGAHQYTLPPDIKLNDYNYLLYYCKPFRVKVGDGELKSN